MPIPRIAITHGKHPSDYRETSAGINSVNHYKGIPENERRWAARTKYTSNRTMCRWYQNLFLLRNWIPAVWDHFLKNLSSFPSHQKTIHDSSKHIPFRQNSGQREKENSGRRQLPSDEKFRLTFGILCFSWQIAPLPPRPIGPFLHNWQDSGEILKNSPNCAKNRIHTKKIVLPFSLMAEKPI